MQSALVCSNRAYLEQVMHALGEIAAARVTIEISVNSSRARMVDRNMQLVRHFAFLQEHASCLAEDTYSVYARKSHMQLSDSGSVNYISLM